MQRMPGDDGGDDDGLRARLETLVHAATHEMPSMCRYATLGILILVIATVIWPRPLLVFVTTSVATSMVWHILSKKRPPASDAKETFYSAAPHSMVMVQNPVFAHDEDADRETPWEPDEDEVADGVREMSELTPPELLHAAQNNDVPSSPTARIPACRFPKDFSELGERLG